MSDSKSKMTRRHILGSAATAAVAGAAALATNGTIEAKEKKPKENRKGGKVIVNGNIKQSIVHWCFSKHWDVEKTAGIAKKMGVGSIELVAPEHFPTLKKYGLEGAIGTIDMAPDPPFLKGFNNPKYWEQVTKATKDAIDACAEYGYKRVICFTGMAEDLSDEEGANNCVKGLKEVVGYAEKKKITLCLEMLNTRDDTHPMKGHPGYQGDGTEYCIDIIKRVGSANLKLLFDIYHVQIMDGDVIRRINQHKEYLGHIHTAGNPGRGELHLDQEINYPAVMKALLDIKYDGYVGQEFIPVEDPLVGLTKAVEMCDV
jgi:hydroxypyruvate isomerase